MIPVGTFLWRAVDSAPTGTLPCDGAAVSRTTYASLFSTLSTNYGSGDGSTTFNVPDVTNRFILGKAASGTGNALGNTGGTLDHTHTITSHTHTVTQPSDHPAHSSDMAHAHDSHVTSGVRSNAAGNTGWNAPTTHVSASAHTHGGAHSAHTGMAVGSAGGGTTGTASAPRIRLRCFIYTENTYANPPVGAIVAYGGSSLGQVLSNVLSGNNTDFEGGIGNWTSSDATLTSSTDQAQGGSRSLKVERTTSLGGTVNLGGREVEAGHNYYFAIFIRAATTVRFVTLHLKFYSDVGETTLLSDVATDSIQESNSAWTAVSVRGLAPTGAIRCRLTVEYANGAIGEVHYLDSAYFTTWSWLSCAGQSFLRTELTELFAVIGTTFGAVDASHFTLPDMRGWIPMGGGTLAATAGQVDHTHTSPSHTHSTTQANAHDTHSSAGSTTHDSHSGTAAANLSLTAQLTAPATHNAQGSHTHDAHSAHTGASAASGGNSPVASANAPTMTTLYMIRGATQSRTPFLPGTIHPFGSNTIPTQYKLCDGSVLNRADFPALFNNIGTQFNTGGESGTQFRLPDARQRFIMGTAASGTGSTNGSYFGAIDHVHVGPSHTHTATQPSAHSDHANQGGHTHDSHTSANRNSGTASQFTGPSTHASGGGHTHDSHSDHTGFAVNSGGTENTSSNNPPYVVANYIILWQYEIETSVTVDVAPTLTRVLLGNRIFSVIVDVLPTLTRALTLQRSLTTVVDILPTLDRQATLARSLSTTVDIAPTLDRQITASRSFAVTVDILPAVTRSIDLSREFAVIVDILPSFTRQTTQSRSLATNVDVEPALDRAVTASREFSVIVDVEPTLDRLITASRSFSTTIDVAPTLTRQLTLSRSLATSVDIAPTLTRQLTQSRSFSVIVDIEPTVSFFKIFQRFFDLKIDIAPRAVFCLDIDLIPDSGGSIIVEEPIFPIFISD